MYSSIYYQVTGMKLIVFTAPSGAGKTTIVRHLLAKYKELAFSVSATTRAARSHELQGKDYYFLSLKEWNQKIKEGDFLEWEEVYTEQYYGTLKSEIERLWGLGKHVLFDIDVKGATNIKKVYGDKAVTIFVKPPSPEILFSRLRNRQTEDEASLKKRIARAAEELTYEKNFDVVLLNDDLNACLQSAAQIIEKIMLNKN
ncbi:MAG: guanylate kinase [Saprospiraceae bacterium]|jgi:guanylate kinase